MPNIIDKIKNDYNFTQSFSPKPMKDFYDKCWRDII